MERRHTLERRLADYRMYIFLVDGVHVAESNDFAMSRKSGQAVQQAAHVVSLYVVVQASVEAARPSCEKVP